jgi:hypothetical protein
LKLLLQSDDQILAELTLRDGETLQPKIKKLANSIQNKEELLDQWKSLLFH